MPGPAHPSSDPDVRRLLVVDEVAPAAFVSLCWDVFFASRGRGVTMAAHFPWLRVPGQACFVTLRCDGEVVAGCAIRFVADSAGRRRGGALGLVCVDPRHRGQGHSARVLERALAHADSLGLADLVLWTSQPGLYARHGFRPDDDALFGTISMPPGTGAGSLALERSAWPDAGETRGLPPFAASAVRWRSAAASAIVLQGPDTPILAEWTGADDDVADLLAHAMPGSWRINALEGDTLPRTLAGRGGDVRLAPSRLRMVRSPDDPAAPGRRYPLRVLDRV